MNFCIDGGWLTGPTRPISGNAADYLWARNGILQGCNSLVCKSCKQKVRYIDHQRPRNNPLPALFDDPSRASDLLVSYPKNRLYYCRCFFCVIDDIRGLDDPEDWQNRNAPPWSCAGHPVLVLPPEQTTGLSTETIAERITEAALTAPPDGLTSQYPAAAFHRIYQLLSASPLKDELSRQLSYHLNALNPQRRATAADFFRREPFAPGAEQVVEILRDQRSGWGGVPNPQYPEQTLDVLLQVVLAARLTRDDSLASLAQQVVVRWGASPVLLEALVVQTPAWVAENIETIYKARPEVSRASELLVETRDLWGRYGSSLQKGFSYIVRHLSDPIFVSQIEALVPSPWAQQILNSRSG